MTACLKGSLKLSEEAPEDLSKKVFDHLLIAGCDRKEAARFRLGLEECLSMCRAHGFTDAEYRVNRRAARVVVRLKFPGMPFNPLCDMIGVEPDGALREYLTRIVTGFSYAYQNKANLLVCRLGKRRKLPAYVPTLIAIAGALAVSGLLELTPWSQTALNEVIAPLSKGYIRLLNTFATPMIFFSVLCGLTNLADIGSLSSLGKRLMKQMCLWGAASGGGAVLIALCCWATIPGSADTIFRGCWPRAICCSASFRRVSSALFRRTTRSPCC